MSQTEVSSQNCKVCLDKLTGGSIKYDTKGGAYCTGCWYVRPPSERAPVRLVSSTFETKAESISSSIVTPSFSSSPALISVPRKPSVATLAANGGYVPRYTSTSQSAVSGNTDKTTTAGGSPSGSPLASTSLSSLPPAQSSSSLSSSSEPAKKTGDEALILESNVAAGSTAVGKEDEKKIASDSSSGTSSTEQNQGGFSSRGAAPNVSDKVDEDLARAGIDVSKITLGSDKGGKNDSELSPSKEAAASNSKSSTTSAVAQAPISEGTGTVVTSTERHCNICKAMGLNVYFILPDSQEALCEACFICNKCKEPIRDDGFVREKIGFLHPECIPRDKCDRCSKDIEGRFVTRDGKKIHAECFVCQLCKALLAGNTFYIRDGMELCDGCKEK